MNREVHVRFWERLEVKLLRATRRVSRVTPVHTALRKTIREMKEDPSRSTIRLLISSHRKLLSSKAMVVNVAETSGQ